MYIDGMPARPAAISARFPALRHTGIAVEFYPAYVNTRLRLHAVDVVLLSYLSRGQCRHVMGDEVHHESAGALGITHYGQAHDLITDRQGVDVFNVYLDLRNHTLPVLPAELRAILPAVLPLHPALQNNLNRRVRLTLGDKAFIDALLARLAVETQRREPGYEEALRSGLRLLLIEMCRAAQTSGFTVSAAPRAVGWLERLRQHLDVHYAEPFSLAEWCAKLRLSKSHICRAFRKYTGKPLIDYLMARRVQAAMLALRTSDDKILAIALACGFSDASYFNRCFRRVVGMTPSAYRHVGVVIR